MNPEAPTEFAPRLIHACAESSTEPAWEEFLARFRPRLRGEVRSVLLRAGTFPDRDLAEDLEQEVLCRLLERDRRILARFRGSTDGEAVVYLRRVVASVVLDALRAAASARRRPALPPLSIETLAAEAIELPDRRGCPEARALARERGRVFLARCRELLGRRATAERLRIVRLALVEGLSTREVVARLGAPWTAGAVDSLLHRLRRRLAEGGCPPPGRRPRPVRRRDG